MNNIDYYDCAIKGFDRSVVAVMIDEHEARIRNGSVFCKAKVSSIKFRLDKQINRAAPNRALFIAASDATDNAPEWVSCTGYTEVNESRKLR